MMPSATTTPPPSLSAPDCDSDPDLDLAQVREEAGEVMRWGQAPNCGHAVVVPFPAQGHLNPAMQLAKQLASHCGLLVTFLITSQFHSRISSSNVILHHNIRFVHIPDGLPPDVDHFAGNLEPLCRAFEGLVAPFELLMRQLMQEGPPVTCIFSDMFAPFTQDVADTFHLPRVALWMQSAASFTVNLHVPLLIDKGHMPVKAESDELITCIPDHPPLAPWELPSFYQVQDLSDFMVQFKLKPFFRLKEATCVLINTFYHLESKIMDAINRELQEENDQHPPVLAAGPFLPPAYISNTIAAGPTPSLDADTRTGTALWEEDNECLKWLDQQAPGSVLYISFGSIVSMEATQFMELASGLDMACSRSDALRVLWVIRPDFLKHAKQERDALMPTTLLGREKEGVVYIASWAPQAMVLSHSAVGAFLTHCGWNSTLEGVSLGVPMLGWPLFSEQWLNRKWVVEEWHIGMRFAEDEERGMVRREEVERVISAMMGMGSPLGHRMRETALHFKHASRAAWMPHGSSFTNLNMVIQNLCC